MLRLQRGYLSRFQRKYVLENLLEFGFSDDLVVGVRSVELLEQVVQRLLRHRRERNVHDAVALNPGNGLSNRIFLNYIFTKVT